MHIYICTCSDFHTKLGFMAHLLDQHTLWGRQVLRGNKAWLLPWESFPATALYAAFTAIALLSAAWIHSTAKFCANDSRQPSPGLLDDVVCITAITIFAPALSLAPCCATFVALIYWHCRACSPEERDGAADCTRFVRFRDPVLQRTYAGKRIDMESLYEMYFDEKLDFIFPTPLSNVLDSDVCLLNDILPRRSEFVTYTLSLSTHLRFLLAQWIPDVLSHSKAQDVSQVGFSLRIFSMCAWPNLYCFQVREHYDRGKLDTKASSPFSSDDAEDDFFGMFLGSSMVYTSGISLGTLASALQTFKQQQQPQQAQQQKATFSEPNESLEQLQDAKLRVICQKLMLSKGETHLDIGCGWGTLANFSASKFGTVVTGVTLSRNQAAHAAMVAKRMKMRDHRVTFWCRDYRDIPTNVGVRYVYAMFMLFRDVSWDGLLACV